MQFELRDIQKEAIVKLRQGVKDGHRTQLVYAPVAFGKTAVAFHITKAATEKGLRVTFVAPYTVLIEQTAARFMQYGLPRPSLIWQNHEWYDKDNLIQIASADTLIRREMPLTDILILDECFTGDTMITTACGVKPIKQVTIADKVKCICEKTGRCFIDNPVRIFDNGTCKISYVKTDKGLVRCTSTHPFYTGESWIQARNLKPQQRIRFLNSQEHVLTKLVRAVVGVVKRIFHLL